MNEGFMVPAARPIPIPGSTGTRRTTTNPTANTNGPSFEELLQARVQAGQGLKVSGHAESRLRERGIQLSQADWSRVETAVNRASQKGAKDAYLMMGQVGFVVNVPNRTVITAMEHGPQTIVTNIDSVVVV